MENSETQKLLLINDNFIKFGGFYYILGWLMIAQIVLALFFTAIITIILSIASFVYLVMSLSTIKKINSVLNDFNLKTFYSKMVLSIAFSIIGSVISEIVQILYPSTIYNVLMYFAEETDTLPEGTMVHFGAIMIGYLINWISYFFTYFAYKSLTQFFIYHQNAFSGFLGGEIIRGAKNLKVAALNYILGFLVITILIGFILQIMGYFKLGNSLKMLRQNPVNGYIFTQNQPYSGAQMGMPMPPGGQYAAGGNFTPGPGVSGSSYTTPPAFEQNTQDTYMMGGAPSSNIPPYIPGSEIENSSNYKKCPICGTNAPIEAKFCPKCGNPL